MVNNSAPTTLENSQSAQTRMTIMTRYHGMLELYRTHTMKLIDALSEMIMPAIIIPIIA